MVWLDDWANRIPIEIDETKIDENLTDFPVLVNITTSGVFDSLTVSGVADAYDVLFMDSRGDQSNIAATVRFGNPSGEESGPAFQTVSGISCIYFDGTTTDLLYCDDNAAYNLSTTDLTIEAWINPSALSGVYCVMAHGFVETQNGAWTFRFGTNGYWGTGIRLNFIVRSGGTIYDLVSDDIASYISTGTWNHIAVVRSSGTVYFYLNGVQRGSASCNYDLTIGGASVLSLNYRYTGSSYADVCLGYVTKWRLSKGIARYTSTFTPPTTYLDDSYVKFMYMAECDMSSYGQPVIPFSEIYVTRVSTPFNRNASYDFGTGTNDFLHITNDAAFDLGSNNFTIDGWAYIRSYSGSYRYIISKRTSGSYTWLMLCVDNSGYFRAFMSNNNSAWQIDFTGAYVPVNTWFHFALVRNGTTVDLYYNGIKTNTGAFSGALYNNSSKSLYVGVGDDTGSGDWYGYMYGLRISKGIVRYTDNFVPGDPLEFNSSFSNRKKIVVTDANNNQLYTEIERWDHANKKAYLWTKVPTVASGTNTQLYLYYDKNKADNSSYVGDVTSLPAQNVWDSNFMAVYHFSSITSVASSLKDSTSSGIVPSSFSGGIGSYMSLPYKIGNGLDLERSSSQYINMPSTISFKGLSYGTIEYIFNIESHPGSDYSSAGHWESTVNAGYTRFSVLVNGIDASTSRLRGIYRDADAGSAQLYDDTFNLALGVDYFASITYNADTDNMKLFRDGIKVGTNATAKGAFTTGAPAQLMIGGASYGPIQFHDGFIDELRLSKIERSEAWIKATYYSNINNLLIFGSIEELPCFFYEGYVNVLGAPAARRVHLYRRSTGQLVDGTTSSGTTGYFKLQSNFLEYHYVIVVPELAEAYPLLFDDKINPGV